MGTYDPMPGDGTDDWGDWLRSFATSADQRIGLLEAASNAGALPGFALLSEFSGADATAKLRTALTATLSDRRGIIIPPNTTFSSSGPTGDAPMDIRTGHCLFGGPVPNTEFAYQHKVQVTGTWPNGFLATNPSAFTRAFVCAGIAWEGPGNAGSNFMKPNTQQLQYSTWQNLSFDNWNKVFDHRVLGFAWTGPGYCNNSRDTPITIAGSDWELFNSGRYFLDSPNLTAAKFLINVTSSNKGIVGPVFNTGNLPTPMRVGGGQRLTINMSEMESLADGTSWPNGPASAGAQLRVDGGNVVAVHPWFFRGMANPSATGRDDNGVVHVAGGLLRLIAPTFGEYNNDETHTENHIACTGGRVELVAPKVWNLQGNSGTGAISTRALKTQKSGSGTIATTTLLEL